MTQAETAQSFEAALKVKRELVGILLLNCGFSTAGGDKVSSQSGWKWQIFNTQCLLQANGLAHSPRFTIDGLHLLPQNRPL